MKNLIDMNGNPTSKGHAVWQVVKAFGPSISEYSHGSDWKVIFESRNEEEARDFQNGIYAEKGYYLNARPDFKESITPYEVGVTVIS